MNKDSTKSDFTKNASVLIVDDIAENLQVLGKMLSNKGLDIGFATSGLQAIEAVKFNPPDLILLDVMMPGIDGFEVCKRIKDEFPHHDIPIIFLTALSRHDDILKGFKAGGVDYITKPFNSGELIARVFTQIELKLSRDLIKDQNSKLSELNSTKNKFFSIISHDLRGPFMGLLGLSDILVKEFDSLSPDEIMEFNKRIHESIKNQYSLLENLLQWANMQTGIIENVPVRLHLTQVIRDVFASMIHNAEAKSIVLNNSTNERHYLNVDRIMIRSLFHNLITNAIKFTPDGGRIDVSSEETDTKIKISVQDSGVGMSQEFIDKLFSIESNKSTPGTNKEKGSGLGLILCKEMIDRNYGTISVESQIGFGTRFIIELPKAITS